MALFVDLDDEAEPPQPHQYHHERHLHGGLKPTWTPVERRLPTPPASDDHPTPSEPSPTELGSNEVAADQNSESAGGTKAKMTEALGCYPVAMAIASSLDLNAMDNLSRTCRSIHQALLQYRNSLISHTLHCVNEDLPVDPDETLRYRARAGNWFYMEDISHGGARGDYNGKSGSCARDMVAECRRCSQVVCRNCAIKPPAPVVLRGRHRRLCIPCTKAPLGSLTKPPLLPGTSIDSDEMQRAICTCTSEGVWLCQPCGRGIRGADQDYHSIWRWRNQYGEVLGGVGIGIGEGDRGVICGREGACCGSKEREQETDCDAEDARDEQARVQNSLFPSGPGTPQSPPVLTGGPGTPMFPDPANNHATDYLATTPPGLLHPMTGSNATTPGGSTRTPSPPYGHSRPGYARHEVEGIGGVVKTMLLRTVKVGACVAEWEDEKTNGKILGRELSGQSRSWCGWCLRVIPGANDYPRHK